MIKNDLKEKVKFKDKNNNLAVVNIEIRQGNNKKVFSMTGEIGDSSGQCDDSIVPANNAQKKLLELWDKYHLNDLNAGTVKQEKKLKELGVSGYDMAKQHLNCYTHDNKSLTAIQTNEITAERQDLIKKIGEQKDRIASVEELKKNSLLDYKDAGFWLINKEFKIKKLFFNKSSLKGFLNSLYRQETKKLSVLEQKLREAKLKTLLYDTGSNGDVYAYGETWHFRELPDDIEEQVRSVVEKIRTLEEANKVSGGSWSDITSKKIVALAKHLGLEPAEAQNDITTEDDLSFSYCGIDYWVLDEYEARNICSDYLEEHWQTVVEAGNTTLGRDDWIESVIDSDGFGSTLNAYDGTEHYDEELKLYIMRR